MAEDTRAQEVDLEDSEIELGSTKKGDMSEFGTTARPSRLLNPAIPDDYEPADESDESSDETEPEQEQETNKRSRLDMISERLMSAEKEDDETSDRDLDRARREGATEQRIAALEAQLTAQDEEEEQDGDSYIDYESPALGKALQDAVNSEDPAEFSRAVGNLTRMEAERVSEEKVSSIQAELDQMKAQRESDDATLELEGNIRGGIGSAEATGGLEAEITAQYKQQGSESLLHQYFVKFPLSMNSAEGVQNAVFAIARMVEKAEDAGYFWPEKSDDPTEPGAVTAVSTTGSTGARSSGANRSVKREAPKSRSGDKSPEEIIRESIVNVRPRSASLPEIFRSGV